MRRVLQVGFGNIGREVFADYSARIPNYMVVDLTHPIPDGYEWDGEGVDLAVILVDTPPGSSHDGYDYTALARAIEDYQSVADFLLIRSTVSLGFLAHNSYVAWQDRIGFSPEFYGATKWSNRDAIDIDWTVFTANVPLWFQQSVEPVEHHRMTGAPEEVILAKLTENAYLATKVTFFHELALLCRQEGIDFERVRRIVTADPRIGPDHSHVEQLGWQSHCFDKDVPAFARLGPSDSIVERAIESNRRLLSLRGTTK